MADEFNSGTTNWWDSARSSTTSSSSSMNNNSGSLVGSFGWPTDIADIKARSSISIDSSASNSVSAGSPSVVFQDHSQTKLQHQQQQQGHDSGHDFHMMGLGLSSPSLDWNQALLRGDKTEPSFRSMLQDNLNSSNNTNYQHHQQDHQWRPDHQQQHHHHSSLNRGFSLDPHHHHNYGLSSSDSTVTCQGLPTSFHHHMDSSPANLYGAGSPSNILQGLLLGTPDHNNNNSSNNQYGMNTVNHDLLSSSSSSWSKVPQFLRSTTSPPKQQLHFSNNAPFWNASAAAAMSNDVRSNSGFFPSLQTPPYPTPTFEEKPKHNISEVRESSTTVTKKSEPTSKRTRNETSSNLPAFKVRKEKMGDRITALQQLVSPFGKTDTASVLSEAIEYIKFLHEQVTVLSTPYMKSGAPIQHHQNSDKSKDNDGPKQDLRSRGLCLVPVSSTFPVTHHEATVDFWTPTFGGTFR